MISLRFIVASVLALIICGYLWGDAQDGKALRLLVALATSLALNAYVWALCVPSPVSPWWMEILYVPSMCLTMCLTVWAAVHLVGGIASGGLFRSLGSVLSTVRDRRGSTNWIGVLRVASVLFSTGAVATYVIRVRLSPFQYALYYGAAVVGASLILTVILAATLNRPKVDWFIAGLLLPLIAPVLLAFLGRGYASSDPYGGWVGRFLARLLGKSCGKCGAPVPLSAHVGQSCPRCGVRWSAERTVYVHR